MGEKTSAFLTAAFWTAAIVGVIHFLIPAWGFARFHGWL
jgi:hypothetical protein